MKKVIAITLCLVFGHIVYSQDFNTGFFLDNYEYQYRLNPALQPQGPTSGFLGIAISNMTLAPKTNVGLSSFFFPYEGRLVNGFNGNIPASQFLSGLPETSNVSADYAHNILAFGFRTKKKGFFNFEINLRTSESVAIPTTFISFLKQGGTEDSPNDFLIKDLYASSRNFIEVALGHSRKYEKLTFGWRLKGLVGVAYADASVETMEIKIPTSNQGNVDIASKGGIMVACPMADVHINNDGGIEFGELSYDDIKPSGLGAAVDLGATYTLLDDNLTLSAAVNDLGFFSWNKSMSAKLDAHVQSSAEDISNIGDVLDDFKFKEDPVTDEKITEMLPAKIRLGARYKMPFYDKLSVGALANFKLANVKLGDYNYNELRLGATITPIKLISLTGNYAFTSFGNSVGAALSLNFGFLRLFAGVDSLITEFTPQYVPVNNVNTTVSAGLYLRFWSNKN